MFRIDSYIKLQNLSKCSASTGNKHNKSIIFQAIIRNMKNLFIT